MSIIKFKDNNSLHYDNKLPRIVDVCILTSNKEKYWVFNEVLDEGWSISLPKKYRTSHSYYVNG